MTNALILLTLLAGAHVVVTWAAAAARGGRARGRAARQVTPRESWPTVSVVVPAWEERGLLERCIRSLKRVDYADWEVVIVAGGRDGTFAHAVDLCRDLSGFRVLEQEPRGKNAALNRGVAASSGEVVVFLDGDCEVSPEWLRALVAPLGGMVHASTGSALPARSTAISRDELMERISAYDVRGSAILQGSASIAITRSALERLGGLPEYVLAGVDWDLDTRLAAAGVGRAYAPVAVVRTERPATIGEFWTNEVRWRRAHLASLLRWRGYFLRDVRSGVRSLYLYALAWLAVAGTVATATAVLILPSTAAAPVLGVWLVFLGWVFLRRVALPIEVAAYTRDRQPIRDAWVTPLLLGVTFCAICAASLTTRRVTMHFKGPRGAALTPGR